MNLGENRIEKCGFHGRFGFLEVPVFRIPEPLLIEFITRSRGALRRHYAWARVILVLVVPPGTRQPRRLRSCSCLHDFYLYSPFVLANPAAG